MVRFQLLAFAASPLDAGGQDIVSSKERCNELSRVQWAVREGAQLEAVLAGWSIAGGRIRGGGGWQEVDGSGWEDITLVAFDHGLQEETRMDRQ